MTDIWFWLSKSIADAALSSRFSIMDDYASKSTPLRDRSVVILSLTLNHNCQCNRLLCFDTSPQSTFLFVFLRVTEQLMKRDLWMQVLIQII